MKTRSHSVLATRVAAAALACFLSASLHAQTWDGGGANDNLNTANNWNPNGVPVINADVIFAGNVRLTPNVSAVFQVNSLTFNNTAGAFVFDGPATLNIGAGGLVNNDATFQTFNNAVSFGGVATSTIDAASGGLALNDDVTLPTGTLTLEGANAITFDGSILGTGTITKTGTGTFNLETGSTPIGADFNLTAGLTRIGADQTLGSSSTVAITGTGELEINQDLTLDGARITRASGLSLSVASGRTLTLQNGGEVIITGFITFGPAVTIDITGAGSRLTTTSTLTLSGVSTATVSAGGRISTGAGAINLGSGSDDVITVDGVGSSLAGGTLSMGSTSGSGSVTFSNGATGALGSLNVGNAMSGGSGAISIQSGAIVSAGNLNLGNSSGADGGTVTITGAGSALTLTGASTATIGAVSFGGDPDALQVNDGATFTSGTGNVLLNTTGTIGISAGTVNLLGPLVRAGGAVSFTSGELSIIDDWNVGTGGLLGTSVTFAATRQFTTSGTTTVDAFRTLTLSGGELSTSALVNHGTIAFNSGVLAITGAGGFDIGSGALGSNVTLGAGSILKVTNTATVASGATLTLNGGAFSATTLSNAGTIRANLGIFIATSGTNHSGGRIFVGDTLTANGAWTNAAGSQLTLENGGLANGTGAIANSGLVTGSGTIANPFNNNAGGEVRGEFGKTLYFTGTTGANAGRVNLLGGTVSLAQQFTNSVTGQINGQGALYFPTTPVPSIFSPAAGLMNAGHINLTGGDSQIYGTVQMQAGSRLIVSGGATASFFDVFRHSGLEVRASAGSNIVFFGDVRGPGSFTGTGTIYFEGGYSPGNSPATVSFEGDLVFGSASALTLEIGGLVSGTEYDHLDIGGTLHADGLLEVALLDGFTPQFGDSFDFFDAAAITGSFDTIDLPAIASDLAWDATNLQSAGQLRVVPEPGVGALLVSALALLGLRRRCFRVARSSRALVSASRGDELPDAPGNDDAFAFREVQKVREGGTPSPTLETSVLPGNRGLALSFTDHLLPITASL